MPPMIQPMEDPESVSSGSVISTVATGSSVVAIGSGKSLVVGDTVGDVVGAAVVAKGSGVEKGLKGS